ncbi:GntP family permease [Halocatena marina]|uniref:GntP family permease n=1 Tax=Halocatena marina TaxID=2934937 RepID=UPI002224BDE7|nr:GntP family permease [Halocatena marina]
MLSPADLVLQLMIAVAIIVALIIILDIHPSISLIVGALYMGLATGLGSMTTVETIGDGFGNLMNSIGIPIIFGIMIGTILAECGGARKIAVTLVDVIPSKYAAYAIGLAAVIISIPVFFDVTFLVLAPVAIAVWQETDVEYPTIVGALAIGAGAAHTFIPPTPNPLAAAGIIGFPLSNMVVAGLLVGIPAVIITIGIYTRIVQFVWKPDSDIKEIPFNAQNNTLENTPSFLASLLPIIAPILLILSVSVSRALTGDVSTPVQFLGSRIIALLIGLVIAVVVFVRVQGLEDLSDQFTEALEPAGLVLTITGAGGAFGAVVQESGSVDSLVDVIGISGNGLGILLLAYALGLVLRAVIGSGTVAGITAMTVVAGIQTTVPGSALAMAALSGGLAFGHINGSGFWIATELSGLNVMGGFKTFTLGQTLCSIFGLTGSVIIALIM